MDPDLRKSLLLFLFGCLLYRLLLVYIAFVLPAGKLVWMGYAALVVALGFSFIYLFDLRKKGVETMGRPIWWNDLRPIHAALYFMFAFSAINRQTQSSYLFLLVDVVFGFAAAVWHHRHHLFT